jgi:hypothetical protein
MPSVQRSAASRVLCAASGDGPDGPSAVPEKFVNIRDILDDVGGTNFVFEDKEEGDVWAHEGRLAALPPAPEGAPRLQCTGA